jgi:hypothetical protein
MTADTSLNEAYKDWQKLAEQESEAIRERDWLRVSDYQNRLKALQPRIIRLTALARQEWQQKGLDRAAKEADLRKMISGLIEIEGQNSSALATAKEGAREKLDQLDLARQNLKRVQRSYSTAYLAVWNSFS